MPFDTPLRYPGGKGRLSNFMREVIELNDLDGGEYVELYAGGAGIALSLLLNGVVSYIHINDLNKSIYSFWHSVLNDSEKLCKRIWDTEITIEEWYRQRTIQDDNSSDVTDVAFSTFFLNRTNRSGIIKGGVIGGKEQLGDWKLNSRFNKKDLVTRIQKIAANASKIMLYQQDAADFIINVLPKLSIKTLVYLDPPYYVKGKGLYQNHYQHADHEKISRLVGNIPQPWLVTYDNVSAISELYAAYSQSTFELRYSAQNRYCGTELLITNNTVTLPNEVKPSRSLNLLKTKADKVL